MNKLSWIVMASLLVLSACGKNASSVSNEAIQTAEEETRWQTLTDDTGRVALVVDKSFTVIPSAEDNGSTTLTAENQNGVLLTVDHVGQLKTEPKQYFEQLTNDVKNHGDNARVGIATENRMNFNVSHTEDTTTFNNSCLATIVEQEIYTVCATGTDIPFEQLDEHLKDVKVQ